MGGTFDLTCTGCCDAVDCNCCFDGIGPVYIPVTFTGVETDCCLDLNLEIIILTSTALGPEGRNCEWSYDGAEELPCNTSISLWINCDLTGTGTVAESTQLYLVIANHDFFGDAEFELIVENSPIDCDAAYELPNIADNAGWCDFSNSTVIVNASGTGTPIGP